MQSVSVWPAPSYRRARAFERWTFRKFRGSVAPSDSVSACAPRQVLFDFRQHLVHLHGPAGAWGDCAAQREVLDTLRRGDPVFKFNLDEFKVGDEGDVDAIVRVGAGIRNIGAMRWRCGSERRATSRYIALGRGSGL